MASFHIPVRLPRYAFYALVLGLVSCVCAEKLAGPDVSSLTPDQIEEKLQVSSPRFSKIVT